MNERFFALSGAFLLAVVLWTLTAGGLDPRAPRPAEAEAGCGPRILKAAADLFDSLDEKAREKALFEFKNEERYNWHFIPRDRKGVPMGELDEGQRSRVRALLGAALSERGARKADEVMAHEAILAGIEGPQRKFARDPRLYYLSFFSRPSREGRWGWRLEGHHLSLNFTLDGDRVLSFTPAFYGANPAIVREGPRKGLRILASVEDMGRDLVSSLPEEERKACAGEISKDEEVPGPQTARYPGPFPAGVTGDRLKEEERKKLRGLIREYTQDFPGELVRDLEDADPKAIHFAWRGSLKPFEAHSYLIHAPGFVINYVNVQNGAAHVHSCIRKLAGDFGLPPEAPGR